LYDNNSKGIILGRDVQMINFNSRISFGPNQAHYPQNNAATNTMAQINQDTNFGAGLIKNNAVSTKLSEQLQVKECPTCKNRQYQDDSDDPGVSMQTPTRLDPSNAAAMVTSHEQEHVVREQAKAAEEGRKVVMQNVIIHTDVCPDCGRVYVSGGETTTVTKPKDNNSDLTGIGKLLDMLV